MNTRFTLILFIIWLGSLPIDCQVYFSHINDSIFVGPQNTENSSEEYGNAEIRSINEHFDLYENPKNNLLEQIEILNQKTELSKAEKHLLKKLLAKEKMVFNELQILEEFLDLWNEKLAKDVINETQTDTSHIILKIPFLTNPSHVEWVKKKVDGCRNAKPDDCLVWCQKVRPETIRCYDSYGNQHRSEGCPEGWHKGDDHCFKKIERIKDSSPKQLPQE